MKHIDSFAHVGITVSDLDRSIEFYSTSFGFKLMGKARFDEDFFEAVPKLYNLKNTVCPIAILSAPCGMQIELFEFQPQLEPEKVPWNRVGITHIALATDNVLEMYEQLKTKDIEFCMEPMVRPDGGHWVFLRDPDGNLIELMEPIKFD